MIRQRHNPSCSFEQWYVSNQNTLAQCRKEFWNVQVSDTTGDDSSNADSFILMIIILMNFNNSLIFIFQIKNFHRVLF